jgi:CRP/FNR family transcriptional regulator
MELQELLAQNPIFGQLDERGRNNLADAAISRRYQQGEWILHYGDVWPYLFVVGEGAVTALKESSEGRSLVVMTLSPGQVFWGVAFFLEGAPMPVALVAEEDTRLHLWSQERLLPMLRENGSLSWELSRLLVKRMLRASDIVEELAFQPVTGRLARLLLGHFESAVGESVARDLTLDEMAARIGSTREMVCRQLYRFADQGAIRINRTEFMITDRELLEQHAERVKG